MHWNTAISIGTTLRALGLALALGSSSLAAAECGNAIVEAGEECDDGDADDTDTCLADCTVNPACGDLTGTWEYNSIGLHFQIVERTAGTVDVHSDVILRDQSTTISEGSGSRSGTSVSWSNSTPFTWTECDILTDGAGVTLVRLNRLACGDAVTSPGEICDDGNSVDGDGCDRYVCNPYVGAPLSMGMRCELCVPGIVGCGNGVVEGDEECDDGNRRGFDACETNCTLPACGNNFLDVGETCDGDLRLTDSLDVLELNGDCVSCATVVEYTATVTPTLGQSLPTPTPTPIPPPALVLHYPFSGDAQNQARPSNHGIVHGATLTEDRFGNPTSAYAFDGNDWIEASADGLPTGTRTVALWFRADDVSPRPCLLAYGGAPQTPPGRTWFMCVNHGGQQSYHMSSHWGSNAIDYFYPESPQGVWHHFAVTTDSGGTNLYVDGILRQHNAIFVADTPSAGTDLAIGVIVNTLGQGPYTDANVSYHRGAIDEVRIYNYALSATEIHALAFPCDHDGIVDAPEEACDDGNEVDGDGCSTICAVEPCYTCAGSPSLCAHAPAGTGCPDDGNPCTVGQCDGAGTCVHAPTVGGESCDDGDACTLNDQCTAGTCSGSPGAVVEGGVFANANAPGNGIQGAFVQVCDSQPLCRVATTDETGHYSVCGLPPGEYTTTAFPGGFFLPASAAPVTIANSEVVSGVDVVVAGPVPPPPDTTITNTGTGQAGIPYVFSRAPTTLVTEACPGGSTTYQMVHDGVVVASGSMAEQPAGTYSATVEALYLQGFVHVEIATECPDTSSETAEFDAFLYIDPSGVVRDRHGVPISGATVLLLRADSAAGPFTAVPDGSAQMSLQNRSNPDLTDAAGRFQWDVVAGYYKVRASKQGCGFGVTDFNETPVLEIPPPALDLDLPLTCDCASMIGGRIALRRLGGTPGDETLLFKGSMPLPLSETLDPLAQGIRFVLKSGSATVVDVAIPPGPYATPPGAGWKVRGNTWTYLDRRTSPTAGIHKIVVRRTATAIKVIVRGRRSSYAVPALPLEASVSVNPGNPLTELCIQGSPALCERNRAATSVTCR